MADNSDLQAAAAAATSEPDNHDAWDTLDGLAADLDDPDAVAAIYREVLGQELSLDTVDLVGERAAQFFEEWYGDDPGQLRQVLTRVLQVNPKADWAFERLTVAFTGAQRWDELLDLYDDALAATVAEPRRIQLLDEAAQVAKDVANIPERAIGYLQKLLPLKNQDEKLADTLERLLERDERWRELIDLWTSRLDHISGTERETSRARIASCWLDNLNDPVQALEALRPLLDEAEDDTKATELLERVLSSEASTAEVRSGALDLLRLHYEGAEKPRETVRVLVSAIDRAEGAERIELHEEAGERLEDLGDDAGAVEHFAALLAMDPDSAVTQEKLRSLAHRSGNWAGYADAMAAAAANSTNVGRTVALLIEAARARLDFLDDENSGIDLLKSALSQEGITSRDERRVARRLAELLAGADRPAERLPVLERLAATETTPSSQRAVIGEAARLAEALGETDRALSAWSSCIATNPNDLDAIDALIALLSKEERWEPLIEALEKRIGHDDSASTRRADLVRIAAVYKDDLDDVDKAIQAWRRVANEYGEDTEAVEALVDLLGKAERWSEQAELLTRASGTETGRVTTRLVQLADAYRQHLGEPERAFDCYRDTLRIDTRHEAARTGLAAMLDNESYRGRAADALADAYRANSEWAGFLELVEPRLADASDPRERFQLLREAAEIQQNQVGEPAAALASLIAAFPLQPTNKVLEQRVIDLAEQTNNWPAAVQALRAAADAAQGDAHEVSHLRLREAQILENSLENDPEAHAAYLAVIGVDPGNLPATRGVVRIGTRLGRWDEAAAAVLSYTGSRGALDDNLLNEIESVAAESSSFDDASRAVQDALDNSGTVTGKLAFEIQNRVARWHLDRRNDADAAQAALSKALAFDGDRIGAVRSLAELQREAGGRPFYDTLRRLADGDPGNLDVLYEGAQVAIGLGDGELIAASLNRLLGRATAVWRGTAQGASTRSPSADVAWAVDRLVDHYVAGDEATTAVDLLVESARLPFGRDTRRAMRLRAAAISSEQLKDNSAAIEMYRSVLAQSPEDTETMQKLAELFEAEERFPELMTLRRHELSLVGDDFERKLDLRLEVSRLVGEVVKRGGRLDALRTNLRESPGHEASIQAISELLDAQGQHSQLADVLDEQATQLEELEQGGRAAELWARIADISENKLSDVDRAIRSHRRVVGLSQAPAALEALARLYVGLDQHANAVPWLEKCLTVADEESKADVALRLAQAHIGADHPSLAIACLESNLPDDAHAPEIRGLLIELYRTGSKWEPLASLLTRSLLLVDDETAIAYAREAAEIYNDRLNAPDKAIPALQKALSVAPDDRSIRLTLASGLRVAERYDEARELLNALLTEFGRRRSAERALVHVELAQLAKAEGQTEEALTQAELASKMDSRNPRILKMAADLALANGKPEEAEKRYRSLLLVVRRQPPGADEAAVGVSEVLFELHKITASRGDGDQAEELLESALEAAVQDDAEVRRMRRSLLAHDEHALLETALRSRLAASDDGDSQARLLTDIADVLDTHLSKPAEALEAQLEAIRLIPDRVDLHDTARELAKRAEKIESYVDCVLETVEKLLRKTDGPLVAELLMKAGLAVEEDAGNLARAAEVYKRVEATGERRGEALFALARVAGAAGDSEEHARALDALVELATAEEPSPSQVDAQYRLAEIFVAQPERRDQGIQMVRAAFRAEPRFPQAGAILKVAAAEDGGNLLMLSLYETVARGSGDNEMLLDFLERRADLPDATPDQIKEAVDVAVEVEQPARGEALLEKAVEAARLSPEGIYGAVWAVVALARQRGGAGDMSAARDLFHEIADIAEPETVNELGLGLAEQAAQSEGDREIAANIYEFLRQRDPAVRAIWEPLVALYRAMGDGDRLQAVISMTLPNLVDPAERNALRVQHANYMIEVLENLDAAIEVLRDLLLDDPDHLEGAALLEDVLRKSGNQEGLADFLWQRFEEAKERGNPETIIDVAQRLGGLLDQMESSDAGTVYGSALELAPDSDVLLRAVIAHLDEYAEPAERAQLMQRLLAVESAENAPRLCAQLITVYESLEDTNGVQRALELGHRQAPGDVSIHQALESWYREREMWRELATMMTEDATAYGEENPGLAVGRLREAAGVYRDMLEDPRAAASVLSRARQLAPSNDAIVGELAACLIAAGEPALAVQGLSDALDPQPADEDGAEQAPTIQGNARVDLLLIRGDLRLELGELSAAINDYEESFGLDGARVGPRFMAVLEEVRRRAGEVSDRDAERAATLRLAGLLGDSGDTDRANELLSGWVEREPRDREPLYILRDMDIRTENWEGVITACSRLVVIEEGEEQISAAVTLATAAANAERPDAARRGLELVHEAQPGSNEVRDQLRRIYELSGAHRELATVLLADGDHGTDDDARFEAYRQAAVVFLFQLGDAQAAVEPASKARELKPEAHETIVMYADVLAGSGEIAQAIALLEPAIASHKRRSPELAQLQQRMARVAAVQGDRENQLAWLKKAFDVDRKNGEIAAELAQLATEMGDYDLALKPLRAITLMDNPGPISRVMALLWEAKIEHARGNRAKAELWAKKALREDPNFAEAQEFLSQISQ